MGRVGAFAATRAMASNGSGNDTLRIVLHLLCVAISGLRRVFHFKRVLNRVVRRSLTFVVENRRLHLRRATACNDRLKAILKVSGHDRSISSRYQASLMRRILVTLPYLLILVETSFRQDAIYHRS